MLTPEDQRKALRCIRDHLVDDGRLVFNIFDLNIDLVGQMRRLSGTLNRRGEFTHPQTGRKVLIFASTQFDFGCQTVDEYMLFEELDEDGRVVSRMCNPMRLRWSYWWEMQYLLEACGFRVEALCGDFRGGSFGAGGEQVWVARKA